MSYSSLPSMWGEDKSMSKQPEWIDAVDTNTTIIVCKENGEQFVPKAFICVYRDGESVDGLCKARDMNGYGILQMVCKMLQGLHIEVRELLNTLIRGDGEVDGNNG